MNYRIPLARPDIGPAERQAVARVLDGPILSRGPALAAFEEDFRSRLGCAHAVAVSSGTAALHLALLALDLPPNAQVITVPFTVPATVNAIIAAGAQPVLVDVEAHTRAMDPRCLDGAIGRRTGAVIVVHPFGQAAPIAPLARLCRARRVPLIEDACEALGSEVNGQALGTFGAAGCFGFYPNKQITSGEGGMAISDDGELAGRIRLLANHGRRMDGHWLDQELVGLNYRMSELNAALGGAQLKRLDAILHTRRRLVRHYRQALEGLPQLVLPAGGEDPIGWFAFVIALAAGLGSRRDRLAAYLAERGIQTGRYFAPLHLQPGLSLLGYHAGDFPVAEGEARRSLALPLFNGLQTTQIDEICDHIGAWLRQQK